MSTTVESIASWATNLSLGDVPDAVLDLCRAQRRSVLAAVAGSVHSGATRRVLTAVQGWSAPGPAPFLGAQDRAMTTAVEDALYAATVLSMALDFDDYMCFGHTGHSAVLVPLLLAAETGASGAEQLLSQVAANEVAARLGGACIVGPQNGQMWSFIHAAGACVAAGRMLGLDAGRMAHALGLALYQPPRATAPGFFMPDSKLLTAAEPAVSGLRAARLATAGVTGPLDALDHPQGFLSAFAEVPLRGLFGRLGEGWATSTLCIKPYPGCAYMDTVLDALGMLGWPQLDCVARVEVDANLLTCAMDVLSAPYVSDRRQLPTPVAVSFSVPWGIAVALVGGEPSPERIDEEWLDTHADDLRDAVAKVSLRHDPLMSQKAVRAFAAVLPPGLVARQLGVSGLLRVVTSLTRSTRLRVGVTRPRWPRRRDQPFVGADPRRPAGFKMLCDSVAQIRRAPTTFNPSSAHPVATSWWDPTSLSRFAMAFPARVRLCTRGGETNEAVVSVPRGAAGHPTEGPETVAITKLLRYGPALWGESGTRAIDVAIARDDDRLWSLLG